MNSFKLSKNPIIKIIIFVMCSAILGTLVIYFGVRFLGMSIVFPEERSYLPIPISSDNNNFSTFNDGQFGQLKNVIFFNIAGLGTGQLLATRYRYFGKNGRLNIERMPYTAMLDVAPLGNDIVPDPHSSAAAIAYGSKAYNKTIAPPKK